jgi:hypothetical protein
MKNEIIQSSGFYDKEGSMKSILSVLCLILFCGFMLCSAYAKETGAQKVTVVEKNGRFQLIRNGKPYYIKGLGVFINPENIIGRIKKIGANSARVWVTAPKFEEMLNSAASNGLTVCAMLDIKLERRGFNYNDAAAVSNQFEIARETVRKYKNNPAILIWGVGNEVHTGAANKSVWNSINDIAKMIHEEDPAHPVMTVVAELSPSVTADVMERCPDIDILGINTYAGLSSLAPRLALSPWKKPVVITEWGPNGHWETGKTSWGAPIEPASGEKALYYESRYQIIQSCSNVVGAYAFVWGLKQEVTPTWYSLLDKDMRTTEAVDYLQFLYTGRYPKNRAPHLMFMTVNGKYPSEDIILGPKTTNQVSLDLTDEENNKLTCTWVIRKESLAAHIGGDKEPELEDIPVDIISWTNNEAQFITPEEKGTYRLYVTVTDGYDHYAAANVPFEVK